MNCSIFWPDVVKNSDRWWFSIMTIYTVHCAVSHFTWPLPVTILRVWRGWLAVFAKSDLVWYLLYILIQSLYKGFHTLHAVGVLTHCASSLLFFVYSVSYLTLSVELVIRMTPHCTTTYVTNTNREEIPECSFVLAGLNYIILNILNMFRNGEVHKKCHQQTACLAKG